MIKSEIPWSSQNLHILIKICRFWFFFKWVPLKINMRNPRTTSVETTFLEVGKPIYAIVCTCSGWKRNVRLRPPPQPWNLKKWFLTQKNEFLTKNCGIVNIRSFRVYCRIWQKVNPFGQNRSKWKDPILPFTSICLIRKVGLPKKWCIWGKCFRLEVPVATLSTQTVPSSAPFQLDYIGVWGSKKPE